VSTLAAAIARVEPVVLEGRHVRLEPLSPAHAPALADAASGQRDTYGFTLVPGNLAEARAYIESALADQAAGKALPFATVARASGRVVGSTRFGNIEFWSWPASSPQARRDGSPDVAEIGWTWLAADAQRTAINTEAKLVMLTHAFETWRVHAVKLNTDARNARSRAAIERIGARFDGVLRAHRPATDGGIRDTAAFSLLAAEWPAARARLQARLTEGHHSP
jgi:RimJ/RimL family protein N-acetyltransferase